MMSVRRTLLIGLRTWLVRVPFSLGRRLPLRRRVVLATAHAARLGGNLAYIRRELAATHPEIEIVVLAHAPARGIGGRLTAAAHAILAGWHLATARLFVVDDYFFPIYVIDPRPGTTIVQTWHASGAFKKIGYSVLGKSFGADATLTSRVPIHANYDICLVGSQRAAPHYAEAFGLPLERFVSRLGIPRTDLFFDHQRRDAAVAALRRRYPIPEDRRVILYAPTFRGDTVTDARQPDNLDIGLLRERLGSDHVLLLRLHPFVRESVRVGPADAGFVIDVSDWRDINELMLVSDVLITDYSSAIYEFALLDRPMLFFAPDHQAYERERGFYFEYRRGVPGPVFDSTEALTAAVRAAAFDRERVAAFRDASFDVADGHATRRFVNEIVLPALAGRNRQSS
jgi:CDP-ribitol ribitolphosphotransferase